LIADVVSYERVVADDVQALAAVMEKRWNLIRPG
jgi:hypothetical protein